jgi:hypothetical protein
MAPLKRRAWLTLRVMLNYNHYRRRLNIEPAENWIALRLIHDCALDKKVTAKKLIAEVAWMTSEATALRTIHKMELDGKLHTERDPKDRRVMIIRPDEALVHLVEKLLTQASKIASR